MARILCKGGRVFDGEGFIEADILAEHGRIVRVEPGILAEEAYVYNAVGKTVLPGMVDAHVHMKGISSDMYGINVEMCALPFGVTAVADAGACRGYRALLEGRGVKNVVFVPVRVRENHADFSSIEQAIDKFGDKVAGIKMCFDRTDGHVRDLTPLRETVAFAGERGYIIMVHSSNTPLPMPQVLSVLRPGDILTHAYHGGENNVAEDGYAALREAKARGVVIDAGMAGHVHTDFAVYAGAIRAGVIPDVISTDITRSSAYKRGGKYGMTMCMSIARHLGMEEADIFRAVTTAPAAALGKSEQWGTLTVGRSADFAVLDWAKEGFSLTDSAGNHVESHMGYRNVLTVADGEVVYRY